MLKLGLGLAAAGALARCMGTGLEGSEKSVGAVAYQAELALIKDLSPDVRFFRFQLPDPRELFFMPVTSTLEVNNTSNISRQYTPVNPNGTLGYFDIVAKRLPGGLITDGFLWKLNVGEHVYSVLRTLPLRYKPNKYKNIGMISAGVGLTPCLQLAREVLTNPYDDTKLWMLCVNRTEADIIMKEDLERLERDYPDRFRVTHLLSMPSSSWSGFRGEVTESVVRTAMPVDPRDVQKNIVLVSGPDSFCTYVAGCIPDPAMSAPGQRRQGARPTLIKGRLTCGFQPGDVYVF